MATRQLTTHDYYDCLQKLGFTKQLAEKRVKISENAAECFAKVTHKNWHEDLKVLIPGSRGEGVAVSLNSDLDIIFLQPSVMCFDKLPVTDSFEDKHDVLFKLNVDGVPEGYAKLELISIRDDSTESRQISAFKDRIKGSLVDQKWLRNDRKLIEATELGGTGFKTGLIEENYDFDEKTGPSQPLRFPLPAFGKKLPLDYVAAFPCSYPSLFDEWYQRKRTGIWPSVDDIEEVKKTDIFVVPVGKTGSEEEHLQWRISFTLAERLLARSFNDTQIKVYVAMKMLCKHELKPICDNITTYIVKNVVLWVYENRSGTFTRDDFSELLVEALQFLKTCVEEKRLDNYIIPYRNLLLGKIPEEKKDDLMNRLDSLIEEGPAALYRCPMIKDFFLLSEESLNKKLLSWRLSDELLLSVGSLEPKKYDDIEHSFHVAKTEQKIVKLFVQLILPDIRNRNPFGYFTVINSMKDNEIMQLMFKAVMMKSEDMWDE